MEYLTAEYYNLSLESQAQVLRAEAERWEQRRHQEQQQLHGASTTTTTSVDSDAIMKVDKTYRLMSILAGR
jgi:hypothetical protein